MRLFFYKINLYNYADSLAKTSLSYQLLQNFFIELENAAMQLAIVR